MLFVSGQEVACKRAAERRVVKENDCEDADWNVEERHRTETALHLRASEIKSENGYLWVWLPQELA